jgi:hypothetical protein
MEKVRRNFAAKLLMALMLRSGDQVDAPVASFRGPSQPEAPWSGGRIVVGR